MRPKYYIEVETRTYQDLDNDEVLVGIPDATVLKANSSHSVSEKLQPEIGTTLTQKRPQSIVLPMPITVKERYLEVREIGSNTVITVIEVLSPKNKQKGSGRIVYEKKRERVLGSLSHLIEIDLLRAHSPMAMLGEVQPTDYRIVVSRSVKRPKANLYGFNLPEPIPSFPLPLLLEDEELSVDLQAIVNSISERARYNERIDYSQRVPPPALSEVNQQWVEELLAPI